MLFVAVLAPFWLRSGEEIIWRLLPLVPQLCVIFPNLGVHVCVSMCVCVCVCVCMHVCVMWSEVKGASRIEVEWRERDREVTQINVSNQTTITSSGSSLPRPPSPLCLSLGGTDRDRVTGKTVSSTTQNPVSLNRKKYFPPYTSCGSHGNYSVLLEWLVSPRFRAHRAGQTGLPVPFAASL